MTTTAISAPALRPGDLITEGPIHKGTVASVEEHNWSVVVTYLDGSEHFTSVLAVLHVERIADRLEDIRASIDAENISWGEISELQSLVPFIDPSDFELLSWAGVTEDES